MKTHYRNFNHPEDVDNWANTFKEFFPSDNDTDKEFLKAIYYYTGNANNIFNDILRYNKSIPCIDFIQLSFHNMMEILPSYQIPENIIVYRYISKGLLKEMCPSYPPQKGMIINDKGFMSTTLIRESVNSYRSGRGQNILLEISVPAGTKGTYIGHLKEMLSEYEVILAPNTKLCIDNKIPFFNSYFRCTVVN